jgi:hypothetical protein
MRRVMRWIAEMILGFSRTDIDRAMSNLEVQVNALESVIDCAVALAVAEVFGGGAMACARCRETAHRLRCELAKKYGLDELRHRLAVLRGL